MHFGGDYGQQTQPPAKSSNFVGMIAGICACFALLLLVLVIVLSIKVNKQDNKAECKKICATSNADICRNVHPACETASPETCKQYINPRTCEPHINATTCKPHINATTCQPICDSVESRCASHKPCPSNSMLMYADGKCECVCETGYGGEDCTPIIFDQMVTSLDGLDASNLVAIHLGTFVGEQPVPLDRIAVTSRFALTTDGKPLNQKVSYSIVLRRGATQIGYGGSELSDELAYTKTIRFDINPNGGATIAQQGDELYLNVIKMSATSNLKRVDIKDIVVALV